MKILTTEHENIKLGRVEVPQARFFRCDLALDVHVENSLKETATLHLYTDLLLSGAGKYSREDFLNSLNALGVTLDISCSKGMVLISVQSLKEHTSKVLSLIETMFTEPHFAKPELTRAIETLINNLTLAEEDARSVARNSFANTLYAFPDRRFVHPPALLKKVVEEVSQADVRSLHVRAMSAKWTLTIGGEVDVIDTVYKRIAKLQKSGTPTQKSTSSPLSLSNRKIVMNHIPGRQNVELAIGGSVPMTLTDKEYVAFAFGISVLGKGGGFSGRLMSTVREKEGLTYGIYAYPEAFTTTETGHWRIMTFFSTKDLKQGITSTLREVNAIRTKGITPVELKRFKVILKTSSTLIYDSLSSTVAYVEELQLRGLTLEQQIELMEKMQKLTLSEVNQALKKYLNSDLITISGAGPTKAVTTILNSFKQSS